MIGANSAEARAHPDPSRDVWELSVWDPTPLSLKTFCLFSPGHILVYWLFLPTTAQDVRPSTTVATTIALIALLSVQLTILQTSFSQQSKDSSVIHKEVMNEYDIKYVHPRTQPVMRDVGTQFSNSRTSHKRRSTHEIDPPDMIDTYEPVIIVNRGFQTNPNPNYVSHVDPDGSMKRETPSRNLSSSVVSAFKTPVHLRDTSSPLQPRTAMRYSQVRSSVGQGTGDGGSLGVYSHAQSPLKKAASMNFARDRSASPFKRESSPLKRTSVPGGMNGGLVNQRWNHLQDAQLRRESGRF